MPKHEFTTCQTAYNPDRPNCATCGGEVGYVHLLLDDKPRCTDCAEWSNWSDTVDVVTGLDAVHTALCLAPPTVDVDVAREAIGLLFHLTFDVVPQAYGSTLLSDEALISELMGRVGDFAGGAEMFSKLLLMFAPEQSPEQITAWMEKANEASASRVAASASEATAMHAALLVLQITEAKTVGEAVYKLDIDFDAFVDAVMQKSIELGSEVRDLPEDVVDDCLAAVKLGRKFGIGDTVEVLPVEPCAICGETLEVRTGQVGRQAADTDDDRYFVVLDDEVGIHISGNGDGRCADTRRQVRFEEHELALVKRWTDDGGHS